MSKLSFNLDRVAEKNGVAFYRVSGSSVKGFFYVGINRPEKLLYIYLSDDFTKPARTIDTTKNFSIKEEDGIDLRILAPTLARSIEILNLDYYPEGVSYAA